MTNEKMLEKITEAIAKITDENEKRAIKMVQNGERFPDCVKTYGIILEELRQQIVDDIRAGEAKKSGKTDVLKLAKDILKEGAKDRKHFAFSHTFDGVHYVLDGYRLIGFREDYGITERPDKMFVNVPNVLPRSHERGEPLELPDADALAAYCKVEKAQGKKERDILFDFGAGLPVVRAKWLLQFMQAFPDSDFCGDKNKIIVEKNGEFVGMFMGVHPAAERKRTEV